MVVYTGSNPMNAHPRHLARYTTFPRGWFRKRGKFDRTLSPGTQNTQDTAKLSDIWMPFEENGDYEFVNAIRAVLKGKKLQKDVILGIPKEDIVELTETMKNIQFGASFLRIGLTHTLSKQRNIDIAIQLIQDLNKYTKWVLLAYEGSLQR